MKFTRALYKAQKGIDACIDLQADYQDEIQEAEALSDLQRALDCLNSICTLLMIAEGRKNR